MGETKRKGAKEMFNKFNKWKNKYDKLKEEYNYLQGKKMDST